MLRMNGSWSRARRIVKQDRSYQSKRVVISYGGIEKGQTVAVLAELHTRGTAPWSRDSTLLSSASAASLSVWAPIMSGLSPSLLTDLPASTFSAPIQQPKWPCYNMTQITSFSASHLTLSKSQSHHNSLLMTFYDLDPLLQALSPPLQPCTTPILSHKPHPHPTLPRCWASNMPVRKCLRAFALAVESLECFSRESLNQSRAHSSPSGLYFRLIDLSRPLYWK